MPMNIGAAIANAGTGFFQGQQQAVDNQYKNSMNKLSLQEATLDAQQKKVDADRMQQLSDYSMQKFNPSPAGPSADANGSPSPQGGQSGTPGGQDPSQQMNATASGAQQGGGQAPFNFVDYNTDMARKAASIGDVSRAEQFGTQAQNAMAQQAAGQQKAATMQLTTLKAQAQALNTTSQMFGGVTDQASYDRVRMQIMSDPNMPQSARQAIASLPDSYSQPIVDHIVQQGQTLSQRMHSQIEQQQLQEKIRMNDFKQKNDALRTQIDQSKADAYVDHQSKQAKVGAVAKVPTANDIAAATDATKEAFGEGVDTNSDDFKAARTSIASRGLQIMRDNRAVNADQAFAIAADEAKKNGEIKDKNIPATYQTILGQNLWTKDKAKTVKTFKSQGNTSSSAIPIHQNMKDSDLVNGKYYTYNGKNYQAVDGKLKPI